LGGLYTSETINGKDAKKNKNKTKNKKKEKMLHKPSKAAGVEADDRLHISEVSKLDGLLLSLTRGLSHPSTLLRKHTSTLLSLLPALTYQDPALEDQG
tara:strand:- start:58 stop:351 length:294 start_codon:yes stop_codon:yes gene_type:complete